MADLIVGEDPINLDELAELIENSPYYPQLLKDWEFFLEYLEVPHKNLVLKEGDGGKGLLHEVLSIWRTEKGKEARLSLLYHAFINCMLHDIAALLEQKYWLVAVKSLKIKLPGGEEASLKEVMKLTSEDQYKRICDEVGFHNMLWVQCIELPKIEVTSEDFYIPRTLISRRPEIDSKVFAEVSDFFLVNGIGKDELEKVPGYLSVDTSGNQLHKVTVRTMVLEWDEHFHRICQNTKDPVHLINYENGSFFWTKSRGNLDAIQRFILESKNYFNEDDLIGKVISPRATIISDSPGMGKSFLLRALAEKVSATNESIVAFITLGELPLKFEGRHSSLRDVFLNIFESICTSKAAGFVLQEMLKNSSYQFDFFLDGYDEVKSDELDIMDSFLCELKNFKNLRIYVTTRPHMRCRLETVLNVISYEILPYSTENQLEFLSSYWQNEFGVECKEKLRGYAEECLDILKAHTEDGEWPLSGFPLHCLEIAKAFQDDVHRGMILSLEAKDAIDVDTMFSTYKSLVDLKFGNTFSSIYWPKGSVRRNYVKAHVYESTAWLLPEWTEILKPHLKGFDKIDENILYSIGLIEKIPYENTRRFVHKTFAEVLLAEFLVKYLGSHSLFVQIVYGEILQLEGNENGLQWHPSKMCGVKYPVVSYLVNMHIRDKTQPRFQFLSSTASQIRLGGGSDLSVRRHGSLVNTTSASLVKGSSFLPGPVLEQSSSIYSMDEFVLNMNIPRRSNKIHFKRFCQAVVTCVTLDLEFCLKLAITLLRHLQFAYVNLPELTDIRDTYIKHILHLAIEKSDSTTTLATALELSKSEFGTQLSYHVYETNDSETYNIHPWVPVLTPLHMAAYHGKSHMASYLVNQYENQIIDLKYLMHTCVRDSSNNDGEQIRNKLAVIQLLLLQAEKYNLDWLNEKCNGRKPSEEHNIHLKLHERLLEMEQHGFLKSTGLTTPLSKLTCSGVPSTGYSSGQTNSMSQLSIVNENKTSNFRGNQNEMLEITDELIGKGGNSQVKKGTFGARIVAVKRIKGEERENEKAMQEIQILLECDDHDNIVQYLMFQSHIDSKGQVEYRIVMEFCESTLKEFVESKESCFQKLNVSKEPSRIKLLRQMAKGLSHLHERRDPIIHRDLKPENILLKARHAKIVVKLADFGISKIISDGKTHHTSKDLAGTIDWIAPELLHALLTKEARVHLTVKVDIFSLGCLFWYVLSNGKHPFVRAPSSESEYQPKLEINYLENQMLYCNILRLILFMISFHDKDRPSIQDIKNHPIFWPAEKKVSFLTESVDLSSKQGQIHVENWLKINYQKLGGGSYSNFDKIFTNVEGQENGWLGCLSENIEKALQNKKSKNSMKYKGKSLVDLLSGIRNIKAHIAEKDESVQIDIGQNHEDFFNYWHSPSRFPFLFDFLWTAFQPVKTRETGKSLDESKLKMLQSFYKGVTFNFSKVIKNENQFVG